MLTAYGCDVVLVLPALSNAGDDTPPSVDVADVLNYAQTLWTPFDHDSVTTACGAAAAAAASAAVEWFADKDAAADHRLCMAWLCTSGELQQLDTSISLPNCSSDKRQA